MLTDPDPVESRHAQATTPRPYGSHPVIAEHGATQGHTVPLDVHRAIVTHRIRKAGFTRNTDPALPGTVACINMPGRHELCHKSPGGVDAR